ncbi:DUF5799 family protein [Halobacteria archaeon AArc-m2/3/4]|uniref:DUF5799 family protein n=1 Tax=Natronoglomus mannanivorans TaxID=2979990 RepID=A0ABT2QDN3_9EURY|nr:DUF5799 family protein [Halobacteria archaeon AArc-m2/3/4]
MSDNSWTDRIVGERMTVDQEFNSRIANSRFTSQEWSLIMTATEFEIENPEDPDAARIVANTEKIEQILPELENVRSQVGAMGGQTQGSGAGSGSGSGGIVDSLKGALGMGSGGGSYDEEREAAETLTREYAEELQAKLESNGRWDSVREAAAES